MDVWALTLQQCVRNNGIVSARIRSNVTQWRVAAGLLGPQDGLAYLTEVRLSQSDTASKLSLTRFEGTTYYRNVLRYCPLGVLPPKMMDPVLRTLHYY